MRNENKSKNKKGTEIKNKNKNTKEIKPSKCRDGAWKGIGWESLSCGSGWEGCA